MWLSVPGRAIGAAYFWAAGGDWRGVAVYEVVCAVVVAGALGWEMWSQGGEQKGNLGVGKGKGKAS